MAEETVENTKKLTVEERIRKLKEIEEKNKEEIKKAQDLLRESEEELEAKEKEKAEIPIPQLRAVDIGELFSEEEKQMFKAKRFEKEKPKKEEEVLEETVAEEEKKLTPEQIELAQKQYRTQLSKEPAAELYNKIKNIYQDVQSSGMMTTEQANQINNIEYALDKKQQDIEKGEYNPSEYAANKLVTTQQIGEELKKKYKG
ncbi:hypothetical protein KY345_06390 [Candidatus Woesearchaeota archaeon]|nr:hypothetical protein [Candidatus Woesearchaeota archaeon]